MIPVILIILGVILVVCGSLLVYVGEYFERKADIYDKFIIGFFTGLTVTLTVGVGYWLIVTGDRQINPQVYSPDAIDVYRCKTTLQITYKDTVPQDTVVVWK